jgi:hypothetical protein
MILKQLYELYHTLQEFSLATTRVELMAPIKDPNEVLVACHPAKAKLPPSHCFHVGQARDYMFSIRFRVLLSLIPMGIYKVHS